MAWDIVAAGRPDATALVCDSGDSWSYRELRRDRDSGIRLLGDRRRLLVFLFTDRHPGGVILHLSCLFLGHVAAWMPDTTSPDQLRALLTRYRPDRLVLARRQAAAWGATLDAAGYRCEETFGVVVAGRSADVDSEVPAEPALLLRTSGTSGPPRFVALSRRGLEANGHAVRSALSLTDRSRAVTGLPLHYTYGLSVLHTHLLAGGSVLLTALPITGGSFWRAVRDRGCDSFAGVPQSFEWLRGTLRRRPELPVPPTMTVSGGPVRRAVTAAMDARCRALGGGFIIMYGQTEATARISVLPPEDTLSRSGSVGRPIGDWHVSIVDDAGNELPLTQVGRVTLRGVSVMLGYTTCREELAGPRGPAGPLDTGDDGFLRDGYLYLIGRRSRIIKPFGIRVALADIEHALGQVANTAVVPRPGESAIVYYESGPSEQAVAGRWRTLAESLRLPADTVRLQPVPRLPTTDRGKIDYRALAALADEPAEPAEVAR